MLISDKDWNRLLQLSLTRDKAIGFLAGIVKELINHVEKRELDADEIARGEDN
jgi:hypothetical protein